MWRTVNPAFNPDIPMFIAGSTVTCVEGSRVWLYNYRQHINLDGNWEKETNLHISLLVSLMVLVDRTGD